jgi:hypothetical protein
VRTARTSGKASADSRAGPRSASVTTARKSPACGLLTTLGAVSLATCSDHHAKRSAAGRSSLRMVTITSAPMSCAYEQAK